MTPPSSPSSEETIERGKSNFHLLVIAPPLHVGNDIIESVFSQTVAPEPHEKPNANSLKISHLSSPDLSQLNLDILSSNADAALIIVDAVSTSDRQHLGLKTLSCLAGIPHLVFAIDNIVSSDEPRARFEVLRTEIVDHAPELDCGSLDIVPVDINDQINISTRAEQFGWDNAGPLLPLLADIRAARKGEPSFGSPAQNSDQFAIHLCWLANAPMLPNRHYLFDNGTRQSQAHVSSLKHCLNLETMQHHAAKRLFHGDIGYANLSLEEAISFHPFAQDRKSGSFHLRDPETTEVVAFGLIKHGLRRATNIRWQTVEVDKRQRAETKKQTPCVLWFTGLSGSGKSAIASLLEKKLHALGKHTYLLDGDNVRHGLCRDLGFTDADRVENLRRISETTKLFVDAGLIVLVSFISPFRSERAAAREMFEKDEFIEIYVDTPLEICEQRDVKGLYKKARAGNLKHFTGIDSPYEPPKNAEIILNSAQHTPDVLADEIIHQMEKGRRLLHNDSTK